jgi:hypothetical protein
MKYCENFVWTERKNNKIEFTMAKNHVLLLLTLTFNMKTKHKMVLLKEFRSRPHHTSYHTKKIKMKHLKLIWVFILSPFSRAEAT